MNFFATRQASWRLLALLHIIRHDLSDSDYVVADAASGQKTAVVLPIAEYERLMEDLGDYAVIADRRKEPTISHEQFVSELKQDGTLPS